MAEYQLLSRTHDRAAFDCGVPALNEFLRRTARQHQDKGVSRTWVRVDAGMAAPTRIIGFFTLSACESPTSDMPANVAKGYPQIMPAVRLGRLAVDREFQGRGLGADILGEATRLVAHIAEQIGVAAMLVDAKDDEAAAFYRRFGFLPFPTEPHQLVLPYIVIRDCVVFLRRFLIFVF